MVNLRGTCHFRLKANVIRPSQNVSHIRSAGVWQGPMVGFFNNTNCDSMQLSENLSLTSPKESYLKNMIYGRANN